MRILVTGWYGMMGHAMTKLLWTEGKHEVVLFGGDITKREDCVRNLRGADTVINLAALTYLPPSWDSPNAYFNINAEGVLNLVSSRAMFKKFIQISTSHVYGEQTKMPIDLDNMPAPQDPYSIAKLAAEKMVEAYAKKHGFDYLIVRPFNNFGPHQSKHFVIPQFINQALANQKIIVRGNTQREFIYVKDTVRIIKTLMDQGDTGLVQIAKAEPYWIAFIADLINKSLGGNIKIIDAPSDRPKDIQKLYGSPRSLLERIPNFKFTPMETAISETVAYYKELQSSYTTENQS